MVIKRKEKLKKAKMKTQRKRLFYFKEGTSIATIKIMSIMSIIDIIGITDIMRNQTIPKMKRR